MHTVKCELSAPTEFCNRPHEESYASKPYRSQFDRDRDRILYSKEFRRLSGKTQVFFASSHDHIRTRLTHTLEVSQISRVACGALGLEPALAEAIALAHDLGHTPFGHVGEKTLSLIMNNCDKVAEFQNFAKPEDKGFKHNLQGLRVACDLEQLYGKPGLNLTNFTMWGVKHHTKDRWSNCSYMYGEKCFLKREPRRCDLAGEILVHFYKKYFPATMQKGTEKKGAWSFEGQVVKYADEIAQRHHDIEDAIHMGVIGWEELLQHLNTNFSKFFDKEDGQIFGELGKSENKDRLVLPLISKFIVGMLNKKLIRNSARNINKFIDSNKILSRNDFIGKYPKIDEDKATNIIGYSEAFGKAERKLQDFLRNRILNSFEVQRMDGKGRFIIRRLFKAYITNPRQLPDSTIYLAFRLFESSTKEWSELTEADIGQMRDAVDSPSRKGDNRFMIALLRAICDHISGMTDNFADSEYDKLYG